MGLPGFYPFSRKKGYNPLTLTHWEARSMHTNKRRIDVLGSSFRVLLSIYSNNPRGKAHELMIKGLAKSGSPSTLVLYLDGQQPEEKSTLENNS
ncbi:hypothetical protein FBU30_001520, partial [Linnemannia zychae]